jgi:uncharacterized protein
LEASIGLAAINSIIDPDPTQLMKLDATLLATKLSIGKNVIIIGHFPFIPKINGLATQYWFWNRIPSLMNILPEMPMSSFPNPI